MSRTIKVYATNCMIYGDILKKAEELGQTNYHNQVHIICGATSMAEANRLCEAEGVSSRTFSRDYTSVTSNEEANELAGNGGIFIQIQKVGEPAKWYSIKQLKGEGKWTVKNK